MIQLRSAALTDIGRVRRRNEDRMINDADLHFYGVADGVGGLPGGAEAAELVLETLRESLASDNQDPDMVALVRAANKVVYHLGRKLSPGTGIGSTLTVGRIHDDRLQIAHVGDSRCYVLRNETLTALTSDHSVENDIRQRRARGEDVHFHEINRNALTRCIGQPNRLEVDLLDFPLQSGDRVLFCTDGITGLVNDEELADFLSRGRDENPPIVLRRIIDLALNRGGHDNTTAVLLCIDNTD